MLKKWIMIAVSIALVLIISFYFYAPFMNAEWQLFGMKPHHIIHKINVLGGVGIFMVLFAVSLLITIKSLKKLSCEKSA